MGNTAGPRRSVLADLRYSQESVCRVQAPRCSFKDAVGHTRISLSPGYWSDCYRLRSADSSRLCLIPTPNRRESISGTNANVEVGICLHFQRIPHLCSSQRPVTRARANMTMSGGPYTEDNGAGDSSRPLHNSKRQTQRREAVGVGAVGGGGGESNSPSKKRLPGYTTGLVGFHYVAWPSSADRVGSSHPAFVFLELRQLSLKAPRHFGAHSQPTGERLG